MSRCTKCNKIIGTLFSGDWETYKGKKYCEKCAESIEKNQPTIHETKKSITQKEGKTLLESTEIAITYVGGGFLLLMGIISLLSFSLSSYMSSGFYIIAGGLLFPPTYRWINKELSIIIEFGPRIIIVFLCLIIIWGIFSFKDTETTESSNDLSQLETQEITGEDIIKTYVNLMNINGFTDYINKYNTMLNYTAGYKKEQVKLWLEYLPKLDKSCTNIVTYCNGILKLATTEQKQSFIGNCNYCVPHYTSKLVNVSLIQENGNITLFNVTLINDGTQQDSIFKLENISNQQKIIDIQTGNKWTSETSLETYKRELLKNKQELDVSAEFLEEIYRNLTQLKEVENSVNISLKSAIKEGNIIAIAINQVGTGTYEANVWYYFEATWTDNYLQAMQDATEMYQEIFTREKKIDSVEITAVELYRDEYGHLQQRILAKSKMSEDTADEIEWDYFQSQNLASVTYFEFYQDSLYKEMSDLQEQLEQLQQYYGMYNPYTALGMYS